MERARSTGPSDVSCHTRVERTCDPGSFPRFEQRRSRDPRYLTNQEDTGSKLIVPILAGGAVVGTLDVESAAIGAFDSPEVARYENLAQALQPL